MHEHAGQFVSLGFGEDRITGLILNEGKSMYEIRVLPEMKVRMKISKTALEEPRLLPEESEMRNYLTFWDTNGAIDDADDDVLALYHDFAEILSERGIEEGLVAKAYGCYGGYNSFECDWEASRDCLLKLIEIGYKPHHADALGYIYYYGRCNGGVPQYEEAYKYFSMAAFSGHYEASYKVADMFLKGYYVPRDIQTAYDIVRRLYDENRDFVMRGEFMSVFANVALRMGRILREATDMNVRDNACDAYRYFLQADFAIRCRIYAYDQNYGDEKVQREAARELREIRDICHGRLDWNEQYLYTIGLVKLSMPKSAVSIRREGKFITFTLLPDEIESVQPRFFVTLPDLDLCGLYDKIVFEDVRGIEEIPEGDACFDSIEDERLFCAKEFVGSIEGSYKLVYPLPGKEPEYQIVAVKTELNGKPIRCICEAKDIRKGDCVRVEITGKPLLTKAEKVWKRRESELEYRPDDYLRVCRVMEE